MKITKYLKPYSDCEIVHLVLTTKSAPYQYAEKTINKMQEGWSIFSQRSPFTKNVIAYVKILEINPDFKMGKFQVHYHVLLIVYNLDKFKDINFWQQQWKTALKIDYIPYIGINFQYSESENTAGKIISYSLKTGEFLRNFEIFREKFPQDFEVQLGYLFESIYRKRMISYSRNLRN